MTGGKSQGKSSLCIAGGVGIESGFEERQDSEMGSDFQLRNRINEDIESGFGCEESSKSFCRIIAVGEPGTS